MPLPKNPPFTNVHSAAPKPPSAPATSESPPPKTEHKPQGQHANDTFQESELRPPIAQFVVNLVLQIAAFAVAIAFGIFAVKSVREAIVANQYANQALDMAQAALDLANTANQLTLLTLCLSSGSTTANITRLCEPVISRTNTTLPDVIADVFPSATPTSTAIPPSSGAGRGASGVITGIVIGVLLGVLAVGLGAWAVARQQKRNRVFRESSSESSTPGLPVWKGSTFRALFVDTRVISRRR